MNQPDRREVRIAEMRIKLADMRANLIGDGEPPCDCDPLEALRAADAARNEYETGRAALIAAARSGRPVPRAEVERVRRLQLWAMLRTIGYQHAVTESLEGL